MAEERPRAPQKRAPRRSSAQATEAEGPVVAHSSRKFTSGFSSFRELLSYVLGAGVLLYGVIEAGPDRQLVIVSAGLALLGLPIVGGIFEGRKGQAP